MADNRKYYYLKLKENFFESEELLLLESMPDGHLYSNILLKLYLRSIKNGGKLMFKDCIPYTPSALSTIVRHPVGVVEKALDIFKTMGLIDVLDTGAIYMLDIQNFIGQSSTEADRQRDYYRKINGEKQALIANNEPCKKSYKNSCKESVPEIDIEIEKEKEIDIEIEDKEATASQSSNPVPYSKIKNLYNSICTAYPKCTALSDARKKAIAARIHSGYTVEDFQRLFEKAQASSFLKGSNNRNWRASFDWLLKDSNMAKVLDGNYDDKGNAMPHNQAADDLDFIPN